MVFSYLLGDNPLFRLAEHLFVGSAAGYAVVVAYHSILRPRLLARLAEDPVGEWYLLVPLLLGLLLLSKGKRSTAWLGNSTMGFLFGTGAALALGGALLGSIGPQIEASWLSLNPSHYPNGWAGILDGVLIVLGTSGAFMHFYYTAPTVRGLGSVWGRIRQGWGRVGYWFILMALGAIFANTIIARLSLLVGRVRFLLDTIGLLGS
jgi:hypothetical protein